MTLVIFVLGIWFKLNHVIDLELWNI